MSKVNIKFDERRQKAFDFSADATKQLITVATGVIAFTVIFSKDFVENVDPSVKWIAIVAWLFYFFSICSGVLTMYSLAGQLEPGAEGEIPKPSIWAGPVNLMMIAQQVCFVIGLLVTLIFGGLALYFPAKQVNPTQSNVTAPGPAPMQTPFALSPTQNAPDPGPTASTRITSPSREAK